MWPTFDINARHGLIIITCLICFNLLPGIVRYVHSRDCAFACACAPALVLRARYPPPGEASLIAPNRVFIILHVSAAMPNTTPQGARIYSIGAYIRPPRPPSPPPPLPLPLCPDDDDDDGDTLSARTLLAPSRSAERGCGYNGVTVNYRPRMVVLDLNRKPARGTRCFY